MYLPMDIDLNNLVYIGKRCLCLAGLEDLCIKMYTTQHY